MTSEPTMPEASFTHHTALVNGVRLHYVIAGKGDPVVLLHGWPQTWYAWRRVIPTLAERYTVIAPDMRGLGDSSKPTTGYEKRTLAEDIYQLVRGLGFERIFLVSHDLGAMVAHAYAAAHGEDVRRLVVLESSIPGFGLEQAMDVSRGGFWHMGFHMARDIAEALVTGRERLYLSYFYKNYAYSPTAIAEADIDEYVRCYSAPGGLRAGFEYYRTFLDDAAYNRSNAKTKLKMPVLALGGETATGSHVLSSLEAVTADVRGGVIERCGHWVPEEQPEYLIEQLLTFFGED